MPKLDKQLEKIARVGAVGRMCTILRLPLSEALLGQGQPNGQTLQWTGIPVSVGVGPTKTLSKLVSRLAKKSAKAGGVLDLVHHPQWIDAALRKTPMGDVWGGPGVDARNEALRAKKRLGRTIWEK